MTSSAGYFPKDSEKFEVVIGTHASVDFIIRLENVSIYLSHAQLAQLGQAVQLALDNEAEANRDREEADAAPQKLPREGE